MRESKGTEEPSRIERLTEELLVRIAVGIGTGLLFLFATPLVLGALAGWWFLAPAGIGFVVGFIGGDIVGARRRRRESPRR